MDDFFSFALVVLLIALLVVCSVAFEGGRIEVKERLLVCEAIGYDGYHASQESCVQIESEDVQIYVSYELVLERLSNDE